VFVISILPLSFCRSMTFRLNFEFFILFSIIFNQFVLTILIMQFLFQARRCNIIGYYDCLPSKKPCPTTTLRINMSSTIVGDEINIESVSQQSSRMYTMSYTSTVSKYLSGHVKYCVCPKTGLGFLTSFCSVFFVFSEFS
jgi:hypothetical protein